LHPIDNEEHDAASDHYSEQTFKKWREERERLSPKEYEELQRARQEEARKHSEEDWRRIQERRSK
jgi:hypothetical protein